MELTSENVNSIFTSCLYEDGEATDNAIMVEGIVSKFGFHPDRLKLHEKEIMELLLQLPKQFQQKTGGGWTFLNACMTESGTQWGEHLNIEQLLTLGLATKKVKYLVPREMWSALPGGMPYFCILNDQK